MNNAANYVALCEIADREVDITEYMAWSMLGIIPDWFIELTKEKS